MNTKYLISDTNPDGMRLEDLLHAVRNDILLRCTSLMTDTRPEAEHVMANNMHILPLLSDAIKLAENSTEVLGRSYGEDHAAKGQLPD